ncbi:MAG: hypothetical protein M3Y56_00485 [Armatimonadota bacterium]|nr:hypothetical protein [Armatimonadota bacterium]
MRIRITVKQLEDRREALSTAADLRRIVWSELPAEPDIEYPLHGTHRDMDGRAYFEVSGVELGTVRELLDQKGYSDRVEVVETCASLGQPCLKCGNIAGPALPTVCPNCQFRNISPCPACRNENPRETYTTLGGNLFRCPTCHNVVHLHYNNPMFVDDGDYNQPLVLIDLAAVPCAV